MILLIDTYDTLRAIEKVVHMDCRPKGVRLDSGNLAELSKEVRGNWMRRTCGILPSIGQRRSG